MITGRASLAMSPMRAIRPTPVPPPMTSRRPTRSEAALAGNATSAPATDAIVATSPIVAVVNPSEAR